MAVTAQHSVGARSIRPFTVEISDDEVGNLRAWIVATRFPSSHRS
jgi:hypothetical protein